MGDALFAGVAGVKGGGVRALGSGDTGVEVEEGGVFGGRRARGGRFRGGRFRWR